ncbi:MAG: ABC transporter substrate-binding protein [Candidatus Acetothermia bacterium]|jgi:peptide/nickel transport system substrate-binding protein|nr:ABC transporter substrate-binding protein [Candidatus Acetothermia bacterium]MDH7504575.1 ABC transporter substrate-binding protein [Candidatus Acetothermia bacterium]
MRKLTLLLILSLALVGVSLPAQQTTNFLVLPLESLPDGLGRRGGSVTIDNIDNPKTFNPIVEQENSSNAVTALLNAPLVEADGSPAVAESYEISADERSITLVLREGIRFSDGVAVTAEDVVFTFNDVLFNPAVQSNKASWRVAGAFPTVEALDASRVRITTPVAVPGLLSLLASVPILPKHLLADAVASGEFNRAWGVDTAPEKIAGLGPFKLRSYTPGHQVVLERNPFYWKVDPNGTQLPYLDRIIIPVVSDDNVRLLRFINGQTEIYPPRAEDLPLIQAHASSGFRVLVSPAGTVDINVFAFNQDVADANLQQLFRDLRFRQAMAYAADRESMISTNLNGLGEPRYGPGIDSTYWIGDQSGFPSYPFNLAQARSLLDQIGLRDTDGDGVREFPAGFPRPGAPVQFNILTVQGSSVLTSDALIFSDDLTKLGLKVTVTPVNFNTLVDRLIGSFPPDYQVARISLGGGGDPNLLRDIYSSQGELHFWKFSDGLGWDVPDWQKEVDRLLEEQATTADLNRRFELLAQFQTIVAENQPLIFLYNAQGLEAYREDRVGNFSGTTLSATLVGSELLFRRD